LPIRHHSPVNDTDGVILTRIRQTLITTTALSRECARVGPFLAMLSPESKTPWLNSAALVSPLANQADEEFAALEAYFAERDRVPRFEFFPRESPDLEAWLIRRGYARLHEMPAMVCTPTDFQPLPSAGVEVETVDADGDLAGAFAVAAEAFGMEDEPVEEHAARDAAAIRNGRMRRAVARVDGVLAGVASLVGDASVGELCGVGTRPRYRRRGVASAVSTALMRQHLDRPEALVWLSAGDDAARRVYERLGFYEVAKEVTYAKGPA
jgi:ribosomal protein S18 acetylase RimI-like enzyme